jgi:hypothetical protein
MLPNAAADTRGCGVAHLPGVNVCGPAPTISPWFEHALIMHLPSVNEKLDWRRKHPLPPSPLPHVSPVTQPADGAFFGRLLVTRARRVSWTLYAELLQRPEGSYRRT